MFDLYRISPRPHRFRNVLHSIDARLYRIVTRTDDPLLFVAAVLVGLVLSLFVALIA